MTRPALDRSDSVGGANRSKCTMNKMVTRRESFGECSSANGNRMSKDSERKEIEASAMETYGSDTDENEADGETRSGGSIDHGAVASTAFGRAFAKIMKRKLPSSSLTDAVGPVLAAHKQLITMKEEEAAMDQKTKGESKKLKQAFREKGHMIPAAYLGAKDKELIKLATRGVVKLFNAVSKAQSVQQVATSLKDSEVKEVAKQSKSIFLETLRSGDNSGLPTMRMQHVGGVADLNKERMIGQEPGWCALRNTFMLGKSRLKDWDTREDVEADMRSTQSSDGGSP